MAKKKNNKNIVEDQKLQELDEVNIMDESNSTILETPSDTSEVKTDNNIDEDLYAPFGDKTFNKDALLGSNTSNTNSDTENLDEFVEEEKPKDAEMEKIKSDNEYLINLDDEILKEHIKQKKTKEEQNEFDLEMIKNYMGANYEVFTKSKFNIYAFLIGGLYLIYRKMYIYGITLYMFGLLFITIFIDQFIILGVVVAVFALLHLMFGKIFNKMYLNRSYNQIKKIEDIYNANKDEYVLSKSKQLGGTNIAITIILALMIGIFVMFVGLQINDFIK